MHQTVLSDMVWMCFNSWPVEWLPALQVGSGQPHPGPVRHPSLETGSACTDFVTGVHWVEPFEVFPAYSSKKFTIKTPNKHSSHFKLNQSSPFRSQVNLPDWGLLPLAGAVLPFDPLAAASPPGQTDSYLQRWARIKVTKKDKHKNMDLFKDVQETVL